MRGGCITLPLPHGQQNSVGRLRDAPKHGAPGKGRQEPGSLPGAVSSLAHLWLPLAGRMTLFGEESRVSARARLAGAPRSTQPGGV